MEAARRLLSYLYSIFFVIGLFSTTNSQAADATKTIGLRISTRQKVPGIFELNQRSRKKADDGKVVSETTKVQWKVSETVIIICDMWDDHYCKLAAQRVSDMVPRMNKVLTAARAHGALIIHAPSGCMNVYKDTPYRKRAETAPYAKPPFALQGWCYLDPKTEAEMPVDVSKGACDDPVPHKAVRHFSKQHPGLTIIGYDAISSNGQEVYNLMKLEGIKNVVMMGVHTNMCVLGRPFGIRQLTRLGFNVALARDLTDAMYDPRNYPYVSHTRGTELVVEHIEQYWCPSIVGVDLMKVIPGSNDPDPSVVKNRKVAGKNEQ